MPHAGDANSWQPGMWLFYFWMQSMHTLHTNCPDMSKLKAACVGTSFKSTAHTPRYATQRSLKMLYNNVSKAIQNKHDSLLLYILQNSLSGSRLSCYPVQ